MNVKPYKINLAACVWYHDDYAITTVIYCDIGEATHECDVKPYIINLVCVWYYDEYTRITVICRDIA